ncbi:unnamed protein product [Coregonus sp. 'balchen']|nr:unnamed protein product [Coregonus sp. 'balchen']
MVSEKVGGAEGTKLDEDFKDLEKRADVTSKAVVDVISKTSEYLQPNPASRAKLTMLNTVSKIRGQVKSPGYPQAEGLLGESMAKFGREIGEDTNFGGALVDVGESMKRLAEVKDSLDIDVKQNFIDPLQAVGKIPDEELRSALEKFHESKEMAESSMHNLLETDVEQVSQMASLVESQLQYHKQAVQVLEELTDKLRERVNEAQSRPRREYTPKPKPSFDYGEPEHSNGGYSPTANSPSYSSELIFLYVCIAPLVEVPSFHRTPSMKVNRHSSEPCAKAMYDFEPENEGELGFREGDIITLTNRIDENWFEGTLRGQSGFFPNNYVEVVVPL